MLNIILNLNLLIKNNKSEYEIKNISNPISLCKF